MKAYSTIDNVVSLQEYCATHNIAHKFARRLARKDAFPGAFKLLNTWAIDRNTPVPDLPEPGKRGAKRADGRQRYNVYMNVDELAAFVASNPDCDVVDPRERARARRAKRAGGDDGE